MAILVANLSVPFDRRVWQESCALTSAGYDVTVICPRSEQDPRKSEVLEGVNIERYRAGPEARALPGYLVEYLVALTSMLWLLARTTRRRRVEVIHACNPPDLLVLVALPFVLLGRARFVFDQHDACPELMIAKGHVSTSLPVRLTRWAERLTYKVAKVVIAPNESYRDIALRRGGKRPDEVFVVRSGPNVGRFAAATADDRFRFGHRFLVAYVGVMGIQDGVDYLLDAAKHCVEGRHRADIQFTLAGAGPEYERLKVRAVDLGLERHLRFLGRVSDDDLATLLASADVCVNPDEFNEMNDISTMNKVLEYMALGRPIVQFDMREGRVSAAGASEYVKPNDAAALGDAIVDLIDDPERRSRMGEEGRERVRTSLSWEHQVPSLVAAYERARSAR